MGKAVIFAGPRVRALKRESQLSTGASRISGTLDPSVTAVNAGAGSIYQNETTGALYSKNDNGLTTNWSSVNTATTSTTYGMTSTNLTNGNKTVSSGSTLFYPNIIVKTGDVYTISTGGFMLSNNITVQSGGTLTVQAGATVEVLA